MDKIKIIIMIVEKICFDFLLLNILIHLLTERILYMNFIILASFIVFSIWLSYQLSKSKKENQKLEKAFWQREHEANSVRKKSLDSLNYIEIPFDTLPLSTLSEDAQVKECIEQITALKEVKIVNLTGFSNTDLKLRYGTANLTVLSEYDQNYTLLVRTLYQWGSLLYAAGYVTEALLPLEFAISTGTDISGNYKLLATIYCEQGNLSKIENLIVTAEGLNSMMKKPILSLLSDIVHSGK